MARKPIIQRIALEGGDAIKAQLLALGDAGEKAFNQIKNAAVKADLAKFGTSLKTFGSDLAAVVQRAALLGAGIAAGAAGATAAVIELAKSGADAADAAGKAAEKTGLQVEAYGKLEFAASQADVANDQFVAGMSKLNKAIAEAAAQGTKAGAAIEQTGVHVTRFGAKAKDAAKAAKPVADIFTKLGINVRDATGKLKTNEQILLEVSDAFARMPDGALKSALAIELFGKAGAELLPFLNEGQKGLRALGDEATRLGIVFTKEQAKIGDDLGDSIAALGKSAAGTRLQLGLLFAPAITVLAQGLTQFINENRDAILRLGAAAARVFASVLGDLLHILSGNTQNVKNPWIREWSIAIIQFGRDLQAVVATVIIPLFSAISDGAKLVAESINSIFGTNISGGQLLIGVALLQLLGVFKLFASSVGVVIAGLRLLGAVLATVFSEGLLAAATAFFGAIIEGATGFLALVAGLVSWPALLVAALVAAGVAIVVFWDDIVAGAQKAIAAIQEFFSAENLAKVFQGLLEGAKQAGELFVQIWQLQIQAIGVVFEGLATIVTGFVQGVLDAIGGLASQLLPSWEGIAVAGGAIWTRISDAAVTGVSFIVDQMTALGGLLSPVWEAITSAGSAVWNTIAGAASFAFGGIVSTVSDAIATVSETIGSLIGAVVDSFTGATSQVVQAASDIAAAIQRATEISGDVQGAAQLADALVAPFRQAQTSIDQIMAGIRNVVQNGFGSLVGIVNSLASQIQAAISRIIAQLQAAAAQAANLKAQAASSSSGGSSKGFKSGGHVRGAGGPKSDSILAWLSNGEFVMQAAAVKKLGVGFLSALNNGFMPSLKSLRGFSMGGVVDGFNRSMSQLTIPRFATGGPVPAMASGVSGRPFVFQFPDGRTAKGTIEESAVSQLQRFAVSAGLLSTGRKPLRGK